MIDPGKQVIVDIAIAAPMEVVWAAITDPAQIATWFGWDAPSLADEIQFIFVDGSTSDPATHRVQFGEWEGSSYAIELSAAGAQTRLRVLRSAPEPLDWAGTYDAIAEGWVTFFHQLKLALEQHRGDTRRTIFLSGATRPGGEEPSIALGLANATNRAVTADYAAELGMGDRISGAVWYRSHFQTGLTVAQWGNGLLAVTDMGVSPERPEGGGSVVLTTYGLGDSHFAALEQRWTDWWTERFAPKG